MYETTRAAYQAVLSGDETGQSATCMFKMVSGLRQACCHGELVPLALQKKAMEAFAELEGRETELTPAEGAAILERFLAPSVVGDGDTAPRLGTSPKIHALLDA